MRCLIMAVLLLMFSSLAAVEPYSDEAFLFFVGMCRMTGHSDGQCVCYISHIEKKIPVKRYHLILFKPEKMTEKEYTTIALARSYCFN